MRLEDSVWQGCFGYWQPLFIGEHILSLGYTAWQGFLNQGRGMVVCHVEIVDPALIDWSKDLVDYKAYFMEELRVAEYLQALELEADLISQLLDTVRTYDPERAIRNGSAERRVLLLTGNGQIDINLLQGLEISPPDCYRQVGDRWEEFSL